MNKCSNINDEALKLRKKFGKLNVRWSEMQRKTFGNLVLEQSIDSVDLDVMHW